jgi:hypothetical protein
VTVDLAATDSGIEVSSGANTLNFPSTVLIEYARAGEAADLLYGNASRNRLDGRGGDDTIDVADGDAGDIVDCGPDATIKGDTVDVDAVQNPSTGTIDLIDFATNCEVVNRVLMN